MGRIALQKEGIAFDPDRLSVIEPVADRNAGAVETVAVPRFQAIVAIQDVRIRLAEQSLRSRRAGGDGRWLPALAQPPENVLGTHKQP